MTKSKLAKIEIPQNWGPFALLKDWISCFKKHTNVTNVGFSLATASKLGHVRNRFISLQELTKDAILFNTNPSSPKVVHMKENPNVSVSFLFFHATFTRQVCIEGAAEMRSMTDEEYERTLFNAKMRAALVEEQSVEVDWDDLKHRHDELVKKIKAGVVTIDCPPDNLVVFKIVPNTVEFYFGPANQIADRILFKRQGKSWTCNHLTA